MIDSIDISELATEKSIEEKLQIFETIIQTIVKHLAYREYEQACTLSIELYRHFNKGLRHIFDNGRPLVESIKYPSRKISDQLLQEERLLSLIAFSKRGPGINGVSNFNEYRWILKAIQEITE